MCGGRETRAGIVTYDALVPEGVPRRAAFRNVDTIRGGTWEALERTRKRAGYFSTGLRKLECARAVAQHMDPSENTPAAFLRLAKR